MVPYEHTSGDRGTRAKEPDGRVAHMVTVMPPPHAKILVRNLITMLAFGVRSVCLRARKAEIRMQAPLRAPMSMCSFNFSPKPTGFFYRPHPTLPFPLAPHPPIFVVVYLTFLYLVRVRAECVGVQCVRFANLQRR